MQPSIDHYIGRGVQEIVSGDEGWDWAIKLEGDVLIRNKDKRRTSSPDEIVGLALMMTTYSELDTILKFGVGKEVTEFKEVTVTPTQYTIAGPGIEEEVYPQRAPELEEMMPQAYSTGGDGTDESLSEPSEEAEVGQEASDDS
jgi:hypothetical protein